MGSPRSEQGIYVPRKTRRVYYVHNAGRFCFKHSDKSDTGRMKEPLHHYNDETFCDACRKVVNR